MITVRNLSVRVADREIVTRLNFAIGAGDFLAILGPNGGGKSTLMKVILGLVPPGEGTVTFETGHRPRVGYVPQIKTLDRTFPARVEELVETALSRSWPRGRNRQHAGLVRQALHEVGAGHLIGSPISALSGGELQRIYLARALLGGPPMVILDEPSAGVDITGTTDLLDLIDRYRKGTGATILMVTHDWDVALHHASHVLLINNEQISFGPPDIAMNDEAIRSAFGHEGHPHAILAGGHTHHD